MEKKNGKKKTKKIITIQITKDGKIISEWWTPELDKLLESLGIPKTHVSRNQYCG
jgi:hypothetical protein